MGKNTNYLATRNKGNSPEGVQFNHEAIRSRFFFPPPIYAAPCLENAIMCHCHAIAHRAMALIPCLGQRNICARCRTPPPGSWSNRLGGVRRVKREPDMEDASMLFQVFSAAYSLFLRNWQPSSHAFIPALSLYHWPHLPETHQPRAPPGELPLKRPSR